MQTARSCPFVCNNAVQEGPGLNRFEPEPFEPEPAEIGSGWNRIWAEPFEPEPAEPAISWTGWNLTQTGPCCDLLIYLLINLLIDCWSVVYRFLIDFQKIFDDLSIDF